MELDELKQVWQRVDQLLEKQESTARLVRMDREMNRVRSSLRPLFWGQICQIVFGVLIVLLAVSYWSQNLDVWYRLTTGIVIHVYGVLAIMLAGLTLARISRIDYAAPVTMIQKRMAQLRSTYVFNGAMVGLPWWFLWVLVLAMLAGLSGADLFANAPGMVIGSIIFGIGGLVTTWIFHCWAHHPARAAFGKRLDDSAAGGSLKKARTILEEARQFEKE